MMNPSISRRTLFAAAGAAVAWCWTRPSLAAQPRRLEAVPAKVPILLGAHPDTDAWTYGGDVPGPELRFRQGERLEIDFHNALPDPTTVHWHGLRVPNGMDGVPGLTQAPVAPGGDFRYAFDLPDAGTYWYHPHVKSSEQVGRGLYGPLIVEEANPPEVDRDIVWAIDDWRLGEDGQIASAFDDLHDMSHGGRSGNVASLNGRDSSVFPVWSGERLRLRLINCANARIFALRFDGVAPVVIALDGQPIRPHAPDGNRVVLGPGQRADLIVDMTGKPGTSAVVIDEATPNQSFVFVELTYDEGAPVRTEPLPAPAALALNPLPPLDLGAADRHELTLAGGAMGGMMGGRFRGQMMGMRDMVRNHGKVWALNGVAFDGPDDPPLLRFRKGRTQVIALRNDTVWPHPMHLHGHVFQVLTRNGTPDPLKPWTDTVMLDREETVEIGFVAAGPGKWLFHCHILEHHAGGMACIAEVS